MAVSEMKDLCIYFWLSAYRVLDFFPVTIPRSDMSVEVGSDPIPIFCRLNPAHSYYKNGNRSDRLILVVGNEDGGYEMESEIMDDMTIKAMYRPDKITSDDVICKLRVDTPRKYHGICKRRIKVGSEWATISNVTYCTYPLPVQN